MIDKNKKYMFEGKEGELLTTTRKKRRFPVVWMNNSGDVITFTPEGYYSEEDRILENSRHLIEVRPSRWVNVYSDNSTVCHATRERADLYEQSNRIACVEVKEGDGI